MKYMLGHYWDRLLDNGLTLLFLSPVILFVGGIILLLLTQWTLIVMFLLFGSMVWLVTKDR